MEPEDITDPEDFNDLSVIIKDASSCYRHPRHQIFLTS